MTKIRRVLTFFKKIHIFTTKNNNISAFLTLTFRLVIPHLMPDPLPKKTGFRHKVFLTRLLEFIPHYDAGAGMTNHHLITRNWLCFFAGQNRKIHLFTCHKRADTKLPILTLALFFQITFLGSCVCCLGS